MNTRLIISLLCAGALAFACGPRSRSRAPATLASALLTRDAATPATSRSATTLATRHRRGDAGRPQVRLASKFDVAVASREVRFALLVTNVGDKHAELDFPSGQSHDFVVVDSVGREVWHWSKGRMFTQSVRNQQLGAREAMRVSETWTAATAKPGRYTAIATLNSTNYPVEERAEFVLR